MAQATQPRSEEVLVSMTLRSAEDWLPPMIIGGLAAVIALSSTVGLGVGDSWTDEQRILTSAALAVASLALWTCSKGKSFGGLMVAFGGLALAGLVSAFTARNVVAALAEWSTLVLMLWLVCSTPNVTSARLQVTAAISSVLIAACYSTGVLANMVSAALVGMPVGRDTFLVGFSNPRFPAQLQAMTLPLLPLAVRMAKRPVVQFAVSLVFALWWMCLIGSGSRTAWLALAVAAVAALFVGNSGRSWLRVQARHFAAGLSLYVIVFWWLAPAIEVATELETGRMLYSHSIEARIQLAEVALGMAIEHPLLGIGPMHFSYVDNGLGAHPHNFWLQLAAEWGVPVALVVLLLFAGLFVRLWQRVKGGSDSREGGPLGVCLLLALAAWFVGTQFDGYMVVPTSQLASLVVLMLCASFVSKDRQLALANGSDMMAARLFRAVPHVLVVLALAVFAVLPFTSFGKPSQRESAWRAEHPGGMYWPRFWQQGWIGPDADPTAR